MRKRTGNKYLCLIGGIAIQLCTGMIYIWSVFQEPVVDYFGWSYAASSYTFSITIASNVLGSLAGGRLNDRRGPGATLLAGGLIGVTGILLTSFVPVEWPGLLYYTYAFLGSFGLGFVYNASVTTAQKWWLDKKGMASGLILCAYGMATVIFAPIISSLLNDPQISVPGTFRRLALVFTYVLALFGWMIRKPSQAYMEANARKTPDAAARPQYSPRETIRAKQYYLLLGATVFLTPAYFIFHPILETMGVMRGLSRSAALAGIMATGIASALGRLAVAWISDHIGRKRTLYMLFATSLASVIGLLFARTYAFILCSVLISFTYGGCAGLSSVLASDYFGTEQQGANLGLMMIAVLISSLTFPALANAVSSDGLPTLWTYVIPLSACVVGIAIVSVLKKPEAYAIPTERTFTGRSRAK